MARYPAALLGLVYGLSEVALGFLKRSRDDSVDADRHSLRRLWVTILIAVTAGIFVSERFTTAWMSRNLTDLWLCLALFVCGLALRWYSIHYLGRFFTVNVAIHSGHEIVDTGPHTLIRHPSYTGALLAFLGIAVGLNNWMSLAIIMIPITWAFMRRMRVEERALANALGKPYTEYIPRNGVRHPFSCAGVQEQPVIACCPSSTQHPLPIHRRQRAAAD